MFCSKQNEILLYNLFDICQGQAVPICMIGLSSQMDVVENLEKRIKSRFSHRHLLVWPVEDCKAYLNSASSLLTLNTSASSTWDAQVNALLATDAAFKLFESTFLFDQSWRILKRILYLSLAYMESGNDQQLEIRHIRRATEKTTKLWISESLVNQISDLSITELCLLIASNHISQNFEGEDFRFEMVLTEYLKFRMRKMPFLPKERGVVFKAWQTLVMLKIKKFKL